MSKLLMCLALGFIAISSSTVSADEVLEAHRKALGGTEAIQKIKSIRRTGDVEMTGQFPAKGTFAEAAIVGKKAYQSMDVGAFKTKEGWNGEKGWGSMNDGPAETLSEERVSNLKMASELSPLMGMLTVGESTKIEPKGEENFEGVACNVYKVDKLTAYLGKKDHLFYGMTGEFNDPASGQKLAIKIVYSDYKEYEGVKFPEKTVVDVGPVVITTKFTKTEINPKLEDALFNAP